MPLPEIGVFKITQSAMVRGTGTPADPQAVMNGESVSSYCETEFWSADLGTGIFRIGDLVRYHHGLFGSDDCGLLNLVRCYSKDDRYRVLDLFETAALTPSSFCFSTAITKSDGSSQALMCIGESSNFSDDGRGAMTGIFIFPRFALPKRARGIQ